MDVRQSIQVLKHTAELINRLKQNLSIYSNLKINIYKRAIALIICLLLFHISTSRFHDTSCMLCADGLFLPHGCMWQLVGSLFMSWLLAGFTTIKAMGIGRP